MNFIKIRLLLIIMTALMGFSAPLMAASSQEEFNRGTQFFKQGDYSAAVKSFEQAEASGMESPALYYNLASSYYKLGNFDKAGEYFSKVRNYKDMQSLAEYNLGLVALKKGDKQSAEKWFAGVASNSQDKTLLALAQQKLETGKTSTKTPAKSTWLNKQWTAYLSGALGYDNNVNFAPLGITTEKSDSFSELVASVDYLFSGDRKTGWLGEAYFYNINYFSEDLYDEYEYGAAIKKNLQINRDWQTNYALNVSKIEYGGEDYQTIYKLGGEARNALSRNKRLYLRYSYEDINSDRAIFDYLQGWRQKFRLEYRSYGKQDNTRLYYELELNKRQDISPGNPPRSTGFFSYSPTRQTLRGRYTSKFNQQWQLIGDLSYRASDYPATANQNRQDDRYKAAAYVDYRFSRDLKLRAKVDYTDNRSTENVFVYKRTVYSLGLSAIF